MQTDFTLSGLALLPDGSLAQSTLSIAQGRIARLSPGLDPHAGFTFDDTLLPGFIDLQLNGAFGFDFTTDARTAAEVAARLPSQGVTAFCPTIVTSRFEDYPARLVELKEASRTPQGSRILGAHLEGPFINPAKRGAHDPAYLRPIDPEEVENWALAGEVAIVTLAPELPGALDAIRRLRRHGIVVSAGHSEATYAQAQAAFEAGVGWGTHLFNAMPALHHREPGLAGALLASDVPCGVIADGVHLHPAVVKAAYRAKGAGGISLVTDAIEAMGMPPGIYGLGGREIRVTETDVRLPDGTLAGSILTMDAALRNVMAFTGCSLADVSRMTSTTPAAVLGLQGEMGSLRPGAWANMVIVNSELQPQATFIAGELVWKK